MAKFTPKVITANDLLLGDVIYRGADGTWVRALSHAQLYTDEATANRDLTHAQAQSDIAVGVYLADAAAGPNGPTPTHFREAFRKTGPSNYHHGKQEVQHV